MYGGEGIALENLENSQANSQFKPGACLPDMYHHPLFPLRPETVNHLQEFIQERWGPTLSCIYLIYGWKFQESVFKQIPHQCQRIVYQGHFST